MYVIDVGTSCAYYELHSVIFIECILTLNLSFWSHDIYCSVHPREGSSSVALLKVSSLFFPLKGYLGVFPDPM